jgi:pyruvate, orthophosphate dikinase
MQARAIFEAAIAMTNQGVQVFPEIMVPLVGTPQACVFLLFIYQCMYTYCLYSSKKVTKSIWCQNRTNKQLIIIADVWYFQELGHQVTLIRQVAEKVFANVGKTIGYKVGTMIEIPRAALVADEVGKTTKFRIAQNFANKFVYLCIPTLVWNLWLLLLFFWFRQPGR